MTMKSQKAIEQRLAVLERVLEQQTANIRASAKGYGGPEGLFLDGRLVERRILRWVLGKRLKPFNAADVMAGW